MTDAVKSMESSLIDAVDEENDDGLKQTGAVRNDGRSKIDAVSKLRDAVDDGNDDGSKQIGAERNDGRSKIDGESKLIKSARLVMETMTDRNK